MENANNEYYKLSWRERLGFCSGDLAQNLIYQTVSIWLMGQIPLVAHYGRHSVGCLRHALFLERFQRFAALSLRNLCGIEHVLHAHQRTLWGAGSLTHSRH